MTSSVYNPDAPLDDDDLEAALDEADLDQGEDADKVMDAMETMIRAISTAVA